MDLSNIKNRQERRLRMYRISELAESVGLSRTTLLYYEKLGLLAGKRQMNGYRVYSDADRQRLQFVKLLQAGGLSLQECHACLDSKLDRNMLAERLRKLEWEIAEKTRSRDLLSALLGQSSLRDWHEDVERVAPDQHRAWLMTQGFTREEAARIVWLSKDMNAHDDYMAGFKEVFSRLDWWGPGSNAATRRAITLLPFSPDLILEIGCGPGMATMTLAETTSARITATDTDEDALNRLRLRACAQGLDDRIEVRNIDMELLSAKEGAWPGEPIDVIWAEGSAYIIGVKRALEAWKALLRPGGVLVFSDMVWRTTTPDEALRSFWASQYPSMATPEKRIAQAKRAGYRLLGHFDMGAEAMDTYFRPLEARVGVLEASMAGHRVIDDLQEELRAWRNCEGQFNFEMFVLQRP